MQKQRRNDHDVTNRVCVADPRAVQAAINEILSTWADAETRKPLPAAFRLFTQLYTGRLPGYVGCDTRYHDAQHSLDCALAYARLFDGHERSVKREERLGGRRGVLGVIIALFHDAGYVRHKRDTADNGAAYTLTHVSRSAAFLREHLPRLGYADEAELGSQIVHFTGYEMALDHIPVRARKDRLLGYFLGTADLLAQTADRCYLEKCRDFLFAEFTACGLAGEGSTSSRMPTYPRMEDLLGSTVDFNTRMRIERLDGAFEGVHRYFAAHFGGRNAYQEALDDNLRRVTQAARRGRFRQDLRRRPRAITREPLRAIARSS
jgi:hypothetical protein